MNSHKATHISDSQNPVLSIPSNAPISHIHPAWLRSYVHYAVSNRHNYISIYQLATAQLWKIYEGNKKHWNHDGLEASNVVHLRYDVIRRIFAPLPGNSPFSRSKFGRWVPGQRSKKVDKCSVYLFHLGAKVLSKMCELEIPLKNQNLPKSHCLSPWGIEIYI